MLSKLKDMLSRHKKKFIISGVVIATGFGLKYAQRKIVEYQEKKLEEFLSKTRRCQHFESTEKTIDQASIGLASQMCQAIIKLLDTESVLNDIRTNSNKKLELWEELKILSFARCAAFVYGISLLVACLRVQLNIIGGCLYKDIRESTEKITKEIQTIYSLVLIQHLMGSGLCKLISVIRENVINVIKNHSLKEKLILSDVEHIFWSIQHSIDKQINKNWIQFVLPEKVHKNQQEEILNKMLADSMDVFECNDFLEVCESSISSGFAHLMDKIAEYYVENNKDKHNDTPSTSREAPENMICYKNDHINLNRISLPLAKVIPILNGLTSQVPSSNEGDKSLKNLGSSLTVLQSLNQQIKNLGANVYEVYSH